MYGMGHRFGFFSRTHTLPGKNKNKVRGVGRLYAFSKSHTGFHFAKRRMFEFVEFLSFMFTICVCIFGGKAACIQGGNQDPPEDV